MCQKEFPSATASASSTQNRSSELHIARHAAALLTDTGIHGHKYAIDAMLSATALTAPGAVTMLTSDPDDIAALCGGRITVIKV